MRWQKKIIRNIVYYGGYPFVWFGVTFMLAPIGAFCNYLIDCDDNTLWKEYKIVRKEFIKELFEEW